MKPVTIEWIAKAEADFISGSRECRARKAPNYDAACFFAQQCIEKYLKARLQEASIPFGKIHDLEALVDSLTPVDPLGVSLFPELTYLSAYAVVFRYPGHSATKAEAIAAIECAKIVRAILRRQLGIHSTKTPRRKRLKQPRTGKGKLNDSA